MKNKKQLNSQIQNNTIACIERDLEILNILKRCITFTDNTITFNATITDENEIKLLKEWVNNDK